MSNEIKREVVERYNRGERATDLAKEYGISRGIIYKWIKEDFPMEEEDSDKTVLSRDKTYGVLEMENRLLRNQLREVYQTLEDMRKHLELISNRIRPLF